MPLPQRATTDHSLKLVLWLSGISGNKAAAMEITLNRDYGFISELFLNLYDYATCKCS